MKYFSNFPKVSYFNGASEQSVFTNLMTRVGLVSALSQNPLVYYKYNLQDGDTPEIIATKYYDDPYRYWMFLYGNNIIDPQYDITLSLNNFELYIKDKYSAAANANSMTALAYTQSTVFEYQKVITTYDSISQSTTINVYNVDQPTYNTLPSGVTTTKYFPDGSYVKITNDRHTISIYDYENNLNESKRSVNIINNRYADDLENQLQSLLST